MGLDENVGVDARTLDRRGFLGAAAGAIGVAAVATSPLAWAKASAAGVAPCTETAAIIPKARRGAMHFTTPAQAWNTTPLFETDFIPFMKSLECNAWEFAGGYPTVGTALTGNTAPDGWIALGSYAKTYG